MAQSFRLLVGIVLVVSLFSSIACTVPETGGSATAAEPTEPVEQFPRGDTSAPSSIFDDQPSGFGVFPAFVPPIGLGGDVQECELGNDPYSTCI